MTSTRGVEGKRGGMAARRGGAAAKRPSPAGTRLQVILARAGLGSRRACEELITQGRVSVNGKTMEALGTRVEDGDAVRLDGRPLVAAQRLRHFMLNKPREVVSTVSDPEGRKTVLDMVPGVRERLYPVGRLDYHSEGLLLLTNDGALTEALTHPRHEVPRTYLARIKGSLSQESRDTLLRGVKIQGRATGPIRARTVRQAPGGVYSWVEVIVHEGRYHLVREALLRVGHLVSRLRRLAFGPLQLGRLAVGEHRELEPSEVEALRQSAGLAPGGMTPVARPRPPKARPGARPGPARSTVGTVAKGRSGRPQSR